MVDASQDGDEREAPLVRPPELRTSEERSATRLELFFDLAYVLVFAQLATAFAGDLSWRGGGVFAALVTVTWWSWVTTTLYANRFDTNDVVYRLAKLSGALAVVGMAASAPEATGSGAVPFGASYLATRVLLVALYARAYRHVREARATIAIYLVATGGGAACWAVSLGVGGVPRHALWAAGIVVEAAAPLLATRFGGGVPLHLEHLPERFGLFVILVLGESIASLAAGVHDAKWRSSSVVVAGVGFVALAALWWSYFDLGGAAGKRRLVREGQDQESGVADAYVYGHLPVTVGLAVFAVGLEQYVAHPQGVTAGARTALHVGTVLFLVGTAAVVAGTSRSWRAAWPWPAALVPLVAGIGVLSGLAPVLGLSGVAVLLVATVLAGIRAQRWGRLETTEV